MEGQFSALIVAHLHCLLRAISATGALGGQET